MFYYPARVVLTAWLPDYVESLMYMALLFPLVIYEGRITLLINTYLKTLRYEKVMLTINTVSVVITSLITIFTTVILHDLNLSVLTILVGQVLRALIAELFLAKKLGINLTKDIVLETALTAVFILSGWYVDSWYSVGIYGLSYLVYLFIKKNDVIKTYTEMKKMITNK